jgi:hypothetical protein
MTARKFDFKDQNAELDRNRSLPPRGISTLYGERASQVTQDAAHLADGLPC